MLMYGAEVRGLLDKECLEKANTVAIKCFLNIPLRNCNKMVYSEMGRYLQV